MNQSGGELTPTHRFGGKSVTYFRTCGAAFVRDWYSVMQRPGASPPGRRGTCSDGTFAANRSDIESQKISSGSLPAANSFSMCGRQ